MLLDNISGSSDERDRLLEELELLKQEFEEESLRLASLQKSLLKIGIGR